MDAVDLNRLRDPFPYADVEWRIGQAGEKNGKIWAKCLAYITGRAIMDRLDDVCGPGEWQVRYTVEDGHVGAGIGIRVGDEWVWKWDGTGTMPSTGGLSEADAGKGDFSNALKRAGVAWGIGRYLYRLEEGWAAVHEDGRNFARLPKDKGSKPFKWDPPGLPEWALPDVEKTEGVDKSTGEITGTSGTSDAAPLGVRYETTRNIALDCEAISADEGIAMDAAAKKSDAHMERAIERLEERIQVKKLSPTPEHEPEAEPAGAAV